VGSDTVIVLGDVRIVVERFTDLNTLDDFILV
jgi:hypothetical protein